MKKFLIGTIAAAGCALLTPGVVGAAYPPEESASPPVVGVLTPQAPAAPQAPAPRASLPSTGSNTEKVLQIGLVSVVAGGALVGTSIRRRSRSAA